MNRKKYPEAMDLVNTASKKSHYYSTFTNVISYFFPMIKARF